MLFGASAPPHHTNARPEFSAWIKPEVLVDKSSADPLGRVIPRARNSRLAAPLKKEESSSLSPFRESWAPRSGCACLGGAGRGVFCCCDVCRRRRQLPGLRHRAARGGRRARARALSAAPPRNCRLRRLELRRAPEKSARSTPRLPRHRASPAAEAEAAQWLLRNRTRCWPSGAPARAAPAAHRCPPSARVAARDVARGAPPIDARPPPAQHRARRRAALRRAHEVHAAGAVLRLRRPRARHQRPDHGDPPQQAPQHLRDEPQRGRRDARAGDGRRRRHGHRRGPGRDQVQRRRPPQPLHLLGEPRAALRGRRRAADGSARAASFRARALPRNRRSPQARSPRRSTRSSAASTR